MAMIDVAVLGSINLDVVIGVEAFPRPGETLMSKTVTQTLGGKGANQAIAAARLGHQVAMIGAVGSDDQSKTLTAMLKETGVDVRSVEWLSGVGAGMAHVIVDARGQNMILVQSGANAAVTPEVVHAHAPAAKVYLTQLETPIATIEAFFRLGAERGAVNILNTAPALPGVEPLMALADIVILNETELSTYAKAGKDRASQARTLITRPGQTIIVTLGEAGALAVTQKDAFTVPAHRVVAVDTTGAGDVFCGVLAAGLAEGRALKAAIARANAAAALSVTRPGAGLSAPTLAELEDYLVANP
jgi:ribokinase